MGTLCSTWNVRTVICTREWVCRSFGLVIPIGKSNNTNDCFLLPLSQQVSMGSAEDKALGGNGLVTEKCIQSRLLPGRVCFVTNLQANAGNGYPFVWSAAEAVITRRQPYPSQ